MAAIEQIIQIAVNERVSSAAQTTANAATTAASNAQTTANTANTNAQAAATAATNAQTTADAAIPRASITNNAGSGLTITGSGSSTTYTFNAPAALNLSDVHTFANPAARNNESSVVWHQGDIAIVTTGGTVGGAFAPTPGNYTYSAFVSANSFRINGGYDTTNDQIQSNLGFGVGDTIQFRLFGSTTLAGSTSGGTDFVVTNIARQGTGSNANLIVTLDRSTLPGAINPAVDVGSTILATSATTVNSGTYVYSGTDQTSAGTTASSDWTLLSAPGDVANLSNLPTFTLDSNEAATLGALIYNSSADTLSINGTDIALATSSSIPGTISRNHYGYSGPALNITGLGPTGTGDQTFTIATTTANWTRNFGPTAVPSAWPQNATLYGLGSKLFYGTDWAFATTDRDSISITIRQAQRRELGAGNTQPLTLEMETLTLT